MDLLSDLNPRQRDAVTFGEGPLLIVAGVGTGKTTVITRRIAWLIAEKKALPAEILALTFTEKAAAEMEERVDVLVPYGYIEAQIGTFHAFCDRVLRENAVLLGLSPDYRILTEAEQAIFLKDHLFDLPLDRYRPLGNPMRHLRALLTLFSRAKDEDVTPTEYQAHADRLVAQAEDADAETDEGCLLIEEATVQDELARAYATYQRLLVESGFVDFGDLITLTLRLFREHPTVLARYRERFAYVLVDEFQDTNYAQFELLKLLASRRNLAVCGDDDQSIYKFRGAAISNILGFQEAYPDAKLIVLERNYRSTQAILDSAYRLIQHNNPDRLEVRCEINKRLLAVGERGRPPHQLHFETLDEECDFVAETIARRRADEDRRLSDFAVLVRSNAQAESFLRALDLLRIPWRFSGSRGLYDQEEIRSAIAFLRVLADPRDTMSLHHVAGSPPYDVPAEALASATGHAHRHNTGLLQILRVASKTPGFLDISEEGRGRIVRLLGDLDVMLPLSTQERTGDLLYRYLSIQTGTIERLSKSESLRDAQRIQNLAKLFSIVERFSRVTRYDRVAWFIDYLDALIEAGDNPAVGDAQWDADAVNVLTIHQAKGLEFPIVFLVGLVSGRFPSSHRRDPVPLPDELVKDLVTSSDFHRQEERRLFYVGMTRAKEDVFLTSAQDYGGKRPRKPSLFVSEALDLDASQLAPQRRSPLSPITRHAAGSEMPQPGSSDELTLFPRGEEILSLSYRKIDDYLTCPLKYRYIHVLRVPIRQHHTVIYGNAIHQAIRLFHLNRIAGRETSLADLHEIFRRHWQAEGFLTPEHEELRLQEGLKALEAFRAFETEEDSIPTHVERRFSLMLNGIRLVGVFDRIDLGAEGVGGTIIDYKTSDVKTEEQATKRAKESRQLALYALAYQRLFDALPASIELRFLTPEVVVGRAAPTEETTERAAADMERTAKGIRAAAFQGKPIYHACRYCAYAAICSEKRSD
jgi:DNA helicase-2/ATP-dependent DNA helicase PcrA